MGFSVADYAAEIKTRRSTTGYIFILANGPVTWNSKRQISDIKHHWRSSSSFEVNWLRRLLSSIQRPRAGQTVWNIDNQSAIKFIKKIQNFINEPSKLTFAPTIFEKVESADIIIEYVSSISKKGIFLQKLYPENVFLSYVM